MAVASFVETLHALPDYPKQAHLSGSLVHAFLFLEIFGRIRDSEVMGYSYRCASHITANQNTRMAMSPSSSVTDRVSVIG